MKSKPKDEPVIKEKISKEERKRLHIEVWAMLGAFRIVLLSIEKRGQKYPEVENLLPGEGDAF